MTLKPLRIFVSASDDIGDVRLAVLDLLAQLKRFFKTRGVELMPTRPGDGPAGGDLAWTLYGKDFGALPEDEFDRAYEAFKDITILWHDISFKRSIKMLGVVILSAMVLFYLLWPDNALEPALNLPREPYPVPQAFPSKSAPRILVRQEHCGGFLPKKGTRYEHVQPFGWQEQGVPTWCLQRQSTLPGYWFDKHKDNWEMIFGDAIHAGHINALRKEAFDYGAPAADQMICRTMISTGTRAL